MKQVMTSLGIASSSIIILISCTSNTKQSSIVGKWIFDKLEKAATTSAADAEKIEKDNQGHTIEFTTNGKYVSMRTSVDTTETGTYEVINEGKMVVTHTNGSIPRTDSIKIAELTDDIVKVLTPGQDVFIMKKVK